MDDEDVGATSQEGREEEDEEDYEETGGKNRLLGFMFGNVDDSGDLDVDYLDEDAKEHLAALADKLGPSITDIELRNSSHAPMDEEDYDEKAEDAIDYEDFDEQYDGPEIQEEDHLLPKKDYFSSMTVTSLDKKNSVFDEDNYDEDDEITEEMEVMERNIERQSFSSADCEDSTKNNEVMVTKADVLSIPSAGDHEDSAKNNEAMETKTEVLDIPFAEKEVIGQDVDAISFPPGEQFNINSSQATSLHGSLSGGSQEGEDMDFDFEEFQEEPNVKQDQADSKNDISLPVLCVEDGKVILKFSEIFGIHEPLKKAEKKDLQRRIAIKEQIKDEEFEVEEDEAIFLRSTPYDMSKIKFPTSYNSEVDTDVQDAFSNVNEQSKHSCVCAEPMKDDSALNISTCQLPTSTPEVYPLDHENWENSIVWGNSPASSHGCSEEFDSETEVRYTDEDAHKNTHEDAHENTDPNIKDHNFLIDPVIVEAFGSRNSSSMTHHFLERNYHPQLLRLDTAQDNNICSDKDIGKVCKENLMHRFNKLSLRNKDLLEGSWLDQVVWDPDQPIPKPKLILDLQDEQMLFEIIDDKDSEHLFSHARAMLMMRSSDNSGDPFDPHNQGTRFNISNDKYYSSRKISMQAKSHPKKRSINGIKVLHSVPALKLQTMKPKLNNKEIANFHRPKALWYPRDNKCIVKAQGTLSTDGIINILLSTLGGGKTIKIDINAEENVSTVISKASKKLDIKPSEKVKVFYCGKELKDDESLESQKVCPNSMLHLVRTKIHVWSRAQKLPGENKPLRPPGAFKKKTDLSVKDGHVFLMEYCEERPLLIGNVGMGARLCTYYQKMASNDQTASSLRNENDGLGTILTLEPSDKSPFLGEIGSGCSQSCLETNMYRAPVFPQKSSTTDYLLVRSAKGVLSLRRIDKLYSIGQQEPHMEVPSPASAKIVQTYLVNRMLAYVYRAFRSMDKPDIIPSIRVDDLAALFPDLTDAIVRKRLKHCADIRRGKDGVVVWSKRRDFRIPNEEDIRGICTPENVCCYESMQAGLYRLKHLGISRLLHPSGLSSAMNQLPDEAIALAAASHIERELQITPWNLTSNFVACTTHNKENIERLEITGVGDPSGRGLGFSFVRVTPKATMSNAAVKKKITSTKLNSTVTGTDADLRRLSMGAACEVLLKFNVPQEEIDKLTRWHRIAKIRQLSSEQAATGVHVDAMTINKFARGQKLSYLQLQQQAREKCQEIWDRQVQSLSATNGDDIDSESEANSDLDSFAGDLENLLDAEEFDEVEDGNIVSKGDKADIVRGRKTRRCHLQSQTEEEIEDDEEEAGFLLRLLQDDEGEPKKKIHPKENGQNSQQVSDNIYLTKKTNQNFSMTRPEIVLTPKEIKFNDSKEMENFLLERNLSGKFITNKVFKEKKDMVRASCRDSFICGACGQHGHMRTNKNCPKYGEDPEALEFETLQVKTYNPDIGNQQLNLSAKTSLPQLSAKVADLEFPENTGLKSNSKLKFKFGSSEKFNEKNTDVESNKPVKISKLVISNKMKSDDGQYETLKPSFIDGEEDRPLKKIIFKQPRTYTDTSPVDENYDIGMGYEYKKTKKITELPFENQNNNENIWYNEEDDIIGEAIYEERPRNYEERSSKNRFFEEHHSLLEASSSRCGEFAWNADRKSSKKKKSKKKKPKADFNDEYILDHKSYRNERRVLPERDRGSKRRPIIDPVELDYAHSSKRQRGAEVMLSNILETIVESLRDTVEISFLFLKPVTKKEAPDYFDIVQRPMDLSTIRDKVRNMEYKSREEFRHDVWQITYNAHIYNDGRNPGIPPLADQLLELCDFHLQEKDYALTKAESAIDR